MSPYFLQMISQSHTHIPTPVAVEAAAALEVPLVDLAVLLEVPPAALQVAPLEALAVRLDPLEAPPVAPRASLLPLRRLLEAPIVQLEESALLLVLLSPLEPLLPLPTEENAPLRLTITH